MNTSHALQPLVHRWLLMLLPGALQAATITVTSMSALQSAISSASPGDVIIVANGVYSLSSAITNTRQATHSGKVSTHKLMKK